MRTPSIRFGYTLVVPALFAVVGCRDDLNAPEPGTAVSDGVSASIAPQAGGMAEQVDIRSPRGPLPLTTPSPQIC